MTQMTGTRRLIRLILRRDRVLMPIWILWLGVIPAAGAAATDALFPTGEQLAAYARTLRTPALTALYGPVFGESLGAVTATRYGIVPVVLGLISLLTVIRHTRAEEEAGRRELLGANVTGRHAGLAAALITTFGANLVVAAMVIVSMSGAGLSPSGSLALGLSYAAVGCVFAALSGVVAQLTESAGAARGIGLSVLGLAFVLRMGGDLSSNGLSSLSWLSPVGWGQQIRPYAGERWWVLLLLFGLTVVLTFGAAALASRRDVGAGLLRARPGPPSAAPGLSSPLALAWRLHRGLLFGWTAGLGVMGFVMGGAADGLGDLFEDTPEFVDVLMRMGGQQGITDAFLAAMLGIFAIVVAGYAIQAGLRMRAEEAGLRAEPVLATSVGRTRWAASHLVFAVVGPSLALMAAGLAEGAAYGLSAGDVGGQIPRVLGGALTQLPAVWVMTGFTVALFGLLPRLTAVSWGVLSVFLFLGLIGPTLQLDQSVLNLSPFAHSPRVPGGELEALPLIWLTGLAALLTLAGLAGFQRRDLASTA